MLENKIHRSKKYCTFTAWGVNNSAAPALRSQQNIFRYETHCLICARELDFQFAKKYPGSKHDISQIDIVIAMVKVVSKTPY